MYKIDAGERMSNRPCFYCVCQSVLSNQIQFFIFFFNHINCIDLDSSNMLKHVLWIRPLSTKS